MPTRYTLDLSSPVALVAPALEVAGRTEQPSVLRASLTLFSLLAQQPLLYCSTFDHADLARSNTALHRRLVSLVLVSSRESHSLARAPTASLHL